MVHLNFISIMITYTGYKVMTLYGHGSLKLYMVMNLYGHGSLKLYIVMVHFKGHDFIWSWFT